MLRLSVDPGKHETVVAVERHGFIESLLTFDGYTWAMMSSTPGWSYAESLIYTRVIFEKPVIHPNTPNPRDILAISRCGERALGYIIARNPGIEVVEKEARQWKGQVPKAAHNLRVYRALTDKERSLLPEGTLEKIQHGIRNPKSYSKKERDGSATFVDMLDAMGLILDDMGRI